LCRCGQSVGRWCSNKGKWGSVFSFFRCATMLLVADASGRGRVHRTRVHSRPYTSSSIVARHSPEP
jgi:hypothetical protein